MNICGIPLIHQVLRGTGNTARTITLLPEEELSGLQMSPCIWWHEEEEMAQLTFSCEWQADIFTYNIFAYLGT